MGHGAPPKTLIGFFDKSDPQSLVNMVPESMQRAMMQVNPKFLRQNDNILATWVKPNDIERRLRFSFWDEYFRAKDQGGPMQISNVFLGICTKEYWYRFILPRPHKVAWLIVPPAEYIVSMREMHDRALSQMRDVLDMDNYVKDAKGRRVPNVRLVAEKIKLFALLDNRVKGAVVQKVQIDQKSQSLHLHATAPEKTKSVGEVEDEIKKVEEQIRRLKAPNANIINEEAIDAESRRVDSAFEAEEVKA
jgi:hypothetical protein